MPWESAIARSRTLTEPINWVCGAVSFSTASAASPKPRPTFRGAGLPVWAQNRRPEPIYHVRVGR